MTLLNAARSRLGNLRMQRELQGVLCVLCFPKRSIAARISTLPWNSCERSIEMSCVDLEFCVKPGGTLAAHVKSAPDQVEIHAVYETTDVDFVIEQLNAAFKIKAADGHALFPIINDSKGRPQNHQLRPLLLAAQTYARNPQGQTLPGWDPAAQKAVIPLDMVKPRKRRKPRTTTLSTSAQPTDAGDGAATPAAAGARVVKTNEVFNRLRVLIDECVLFASGSRCGSCVRVVFAGEGRTTCTIGRAN